ncbi:MAG: sugar ABC transporter ATP-binding protein [Chloroflexota bacterium]|nr:sugar ABC transporter ATP-binding protein [Chloroflexota bacterium]
MPALANITRSDPATPVTERPLLELDSISKGFAAVQALQDISLHVMPGEVLALMGENGAGKSTLLRILSGDYRPDSGAIRLDGSPIAFRSPLDARESGIRVIYQEPEIVPGVDIAENVYVGELPHRGPFVDRRRLQALLRADLHRYGFEAVLPPTLMGDQLSPAQRQLVEILRALKAGVRVLALDEPTSSLTDSEVDRLFALVHQLRRQGVGVIYVSHRIKEILRISDRVAVLRDGRLVDVRPASELTEDEIVRLMVGREVRDVFQRKRAVRERVLLQVEHLDSTWHRDISFEIRTGEVVGLAGLVGAGRTELAKVIFGDLPRSGGRVLVDGKALDAHHPRHGIAAGIGFAPEDRKREALVLPRSVRENVALAMLNQLAHFHLVRRALERRTVQTFVDRLRVRTPSIEQEVGKLSGGNQQKVVLARWLARKPKVLILDEPTRGIDVGAKAEIYRLIDELANEGMAIMVISSELPEILGLSDRIVVMQNGRITGELPGPTATEEAVLGLAMVDHLSTTREAPA